MKNEFDLLNDAVIDFTDYEDYPELSYFEKRRIKKRIKKKIGNGLKFSQRRMIAAVLCVSLLVCVGFNDDVKAFAGKVASYIPLVQGMIDTYVGKTEKSLTDYKTVVGETVSKHGVSVRLDELLFDKGRLIVSSTFHSNEINLSEVTYAFPKVYVNGKDDDIRGGSWNKTKIDDFTYAFVSAVDLGNTAIEGNIEVQIVYENLRSQNGNQVEGTWGFTIQTSSEQLYRDTKTIEINRSFTLENGQEIHISDLELSPVSTRINYQMTNGLDLDVLFQVKDSNGVMLKPVSALTLTRDSHIRFSTLQDNITKLTLIPYTISGKEGDNIPKDKVLLFDEGFDIKIK